MKSGTKKCRGEEALVLTTEYTEAGEPILKNTERSSVYSVWERKRPFCVFCGKKIAADGLTPSLTKGFRSRVRLLRAWKAREKSIHISWKVNVGLACEICCENFRPIFHEKWDEKLPR